MPVKIFGPPGASSGSGSVGGPDGATDGAIAVWDGPSGLLLRNSTYLISSFNNLTIGGALAIRQTGGSVYYGLSGNTTATGVNNTTLGSGAGLALTTGDTNTLIGHQAGLSITTAQQTVAIGRHALRSITGSIANVAVGESAGYKLISGIDNVFIGSDAGYSGNETGGVTTGSHNTCVGNNAGETGTFPNYDDVTGSDNTALGHGAGWSGGAASFQTAIGSGAKCTADNQITLGRAADSINVPGTGNVSVAKKFTITLGDVAGLGAVMAGDIALFTLPAGGKITGVTVKNTTEAFDIGLAVSIGTAAAATAFSSSFSLTTAVTDANFQDTDQWKSTSFAATGVVAHFTASGDMENVAQGGPLNIWISYVVLPA